MDEVVKKLESIDTQEASEAVSRLQKRLGSAREPQLLGEIIDYFVVSGSKQALKVLSSLKDVQSQDFFCKLNDCMHSKVPMRLPVLRLLAHCLNRPTSWLYKIVQHPLFPSILHYLKISHDVLVLTSGVLVLAAILPLAPSNLSSHLPDIFQIFADLATIRTSDRLKLVPQPLYLHLDVAVYYLFLQLYALFPCNFFTFLRGRYGPMGERRDFYQYIAPLFNFVRFHPGLVMDSNAIETHGDKWRSMEPDEIATLSLTMCFDMTIAPSVEEGSETGSAIPIPPSLHFWEPTAFPESAPQDEELTEDLRIVPPERQFHLYSRPPPPLSDPSPLRGTYPSSCQSSCYTSGGGTPSPVKGVSPRNTRKQQQAKGSDRRKGSGGTNSLVRDVPYADRGSNVAAPSVDATNQTGFKLTKELMWSPSMMFDSTISTEASRQSSRTGYPAFPGHSSETSATTSMPGTSHHTPRPMTTPTFTYMSYSPTASVGGESLSRQSSNHTPSAASVAESGTRQPLQGGDPFISGSNRLTQSLHTSPVSGRGGNGSRQAVPGSNKGMPPSSVSIRNRFERFLNIFSSNKRDLQKDFEEFTEVSESDVVPTATQRSRSLDGAESGVGVRGVSGEGVSGEGVRERLVMGETEVGIEELPMGNEEIRCRSGADSDGEREEGRREVVQPEREDTEVEEEDKELKEDNAPDQPTTVPLCMTTSITETRRSLLPASFPGGGRTHREGGPREVSRRRASHSESVAHTVQQVQERLRELAESQNVEDELSSGELNREGEEEEADVGCDTPKNRSNVFSSRDMSSGSLPESYSGLVSQPVKHDSSHTLVGSLSNSSVFASQRVAMARSLDTNEHGEALTGSLLREREGSGLIMRRVSVRDRKSTSFGTQTSTIGSPIDCTPSPVALLDQLVRHGEIVHEGNAQDIPLTELEGIDWFHYGGCPHNEELGQMQSQVALLHSQLLFERHRCLQHARRNRRLLSKARNAHRIREELEYLRHHCWHESIMRQSLEQAQVGQGAGQGVGCEAESGKWERMRSENQALLSRNQTLQADNHKLRVELVRQQEENTKLTGKVKEMGERVLALESERTVVQPQLAETQLLREKVVALERELLVLSRLYHNQKDEILSLRAHSTGKQEWSQLTRALKEEKEAAEKKMAGLRQETEGLRIMVSSLREESSRVQEEKGVLQQILLHVQGRCQQKIKASEEKYEAMVAVAHQLESHITELKARNFPRKKHSPHRHKRSSSHPAVQRTSPAQTAPSHHHTTHTHPPLTQPF